MNMDKQVRVLLIGDDSYEMYVKAFYDGFKTLEYKNVRLFAENENIQMHGKKNSLMLRAEKKLAWGPHVSGMNRNFIRELRLFQPELVFAYSSRFLDKKSVDEIKNLGCTLFVYNNDNPFADYYPGYFWRRYLYLAERADVGFAYRTKNIEDYQKIGCKRVFLLRSYYIDSKNYFIKNPEIDVPDVVFLGHYEKDGREEYIKALADNGIKVGITERTWEYFEKDNPLVVKLPDSHTRYNEILNACKIAIVFLSKINNDTYTRRCFEIPATKTLMVAPYTEDLASLFEEGKEIIFYRNKQDFVKKISYYLAHENERKKIAEAGYKRLLFDGNEVKDRIQYIMQIYGDIQAGINDKKDF